MAEGRLDRNRILSKLHTRRIGRSLELHDDLDSTNRHVLEHLQAGGGDGLTVIAEHQGAGRGRRGRSWHCPAGAGILCTVGVRDRGRVLDATLLSLIVPIAVSDGIHEASAVRSEIKWPNDLIVRNRKLGGVLIESAVDCGGALCYTIGFGINCLQHPKHFPPELRGTATSLDVESAQPVHRESVLLSVLSALDGWLAEPQRWNPEAICAQWKQLAWGLGSRVRLEHQSRLYEGILLDIDPNAAILVQLDEGGRRLFSASSTTVVEQLA